MKKLILFFALLPLLLVGEEVPVEIPPLPPPPAWTLEQFIADQDGFYKAWVEYFQKLPAYAKEVEQFLPEEKRKELAIFYSPKYQVYLRENNKYFPISATCTIFGGPYDFNAYCYLNRLFNYPYNPKEISTVSVIIGIEQPEGMKDKARIEIYGAAIFCSNGIIEPVFLPDKTVNILLSFGLPYYFCYDVYGVVVGMMDGNAYGLNINYLCSGSNVMNGLQVSPLGNYASILNGLQIGLFNGAKSSQSFGLQIGLLNNNGRIWLPLINLVY